MKRILIALITIFIFSGCNQNNEEEVIRLVLEKQALEQQLINRDSTLNSFFYSLNQIEENLQIIKQKEGVISSGTSSGVELQGDKMLQLNDDIRQVGELMEKNRQLINRLNRNHKNSGVRIAELDKMLERLNNQLQEKEVEIAILKEELASLNLRVELLVATVDSLEDERRRQDQVISIKELELNTAWYALGSKSELAQNGIITLSGGFLGLGRSMKLNSEFNPDYFTRVDISHTYEITIPGRKPQVVSIHPQGSWELRQDGELFFLDILDTRKFWSTSRHLVVVMD
jgi:hypothetical protein